MRGKSHAHSVAVLRFRAATQGEAPLRLLKWAVSLQSEEPQAFTPVDGWLEDAGLHRNSLRK